MALPDRVFVIVVESQGERDPERMPLLGRPDDGGRLTPVFRSMVLATTFLLRALPLACGAVGTLTATGQLSARGQEAFDNQLIHGGFVAQSMVQASDADRRAIIRLLTASPGLSQNWAKSPALQAWLERALAIHP